MADPTPTDTSAQLSRQAVIDRLALEMARLIEAEAGGNVEQGQHDGVRYVVNVVDQLHRDAHAGLALEGMAAASEARQ